MSNTRKLRRWIQMAMFSEPWQPSDPPPEPIKAKKIVASKARRPSKWARRSA